MSNITQNYRFDRNIIYHVKDFAVPELYEMAVETLFFFASLCQSNKNTLFDEELPMMEYAVRASDFIKYSGRVKSSIYKSHGDWSINVKANSTGSEVKLHTVFEFLMYQFRTKELPFHDVYKYGKHDFVSVAGKTFLNDFKVDLSPVAKTKEKIYLITFNPYFLHSLLEQYVVFNNNDLLPIRGNKKNSLYSVYLHLLRLENDFRISSNNTILMTYFNVKRISGISIQSPNESSNISKTVKKFSIYLDKIKSQTSLDFDYTVDNNNFLFTFSRKPKNISDDKKINLFLLNLEQAIIDFYSTKNIAYSKGLDKILLKEYGEELIPYCLSKFIDLEYQDNAIYQNKLNWFCKMISKRFDSTQIDEKQVLAYYWKGNKLL